MNPFRFFNRQGMTYIGFATIVILLLVVLVSDFHFPSISEIGETTSNVIKKIADIKDDLADMTLKYDAKKESIPIIETSTEPSEILAPVITDEIQTVDYPPMDPEEKPTKETAPDFVATQTKINLPSVRLDMNDTNNGPSANKPLKKEADAFSVNNNLDLAIVHKGKGIEHVLIQQLIADPNLGKDYQIKNGESLKKWAGRVASIINHKAGYINKDNEVRVKVTDKVAYKLITSADGEVTVVELVENDGEFAQVNSIGVPASGAEPLKRLASYEYLHVLTG